MQMENNHMKTCCKSYMIRKMRIKMRYHTTAIRMPKVQKLTTQILTRTWSKRNSQTLLVEMQNGTAIWEDTMAVTYTTKHIITIWRSNCSSWYYLKGSENLHPHKNQHTHVSSCFINNCQNLEAPCCPSVGERVNCGTFIQWIIQH